jgi:hypothetical protein
METLGLILFLVVLVEGLVEHFGAPVPSTFKPYLAALLGVALCMAYGADLPAALGFTALFPFIGQVLTGVMISRGSNYINDLLGRVRGERFLYSMREVRIEEGDAYQAAKDAHDAQMGE